MALIFIQSSYLFWRRPLTVIRFVWLVCGCALTMANTDRSLPISERCATRCKPVIDVLNLGKPHRLSGSAISAMVIGKRLRLIQDLLQPAVRQSQTFFPDGTWEKAEYQITLVARHGVWRVSKDRLCITQLNKMERCLRVWIYPNSPDVILIEDPEVASYGRLTLAFKSTSL